MTSVLTESGLAVVKNESRGPLKTDRSPGKG